MSKPMKSKPGQVAERLRKLEGDNVVLRALLAEKKRKSDAPIDLKLSEEDLWDWCESFYLDSGGEDWAIDGLMLLLWNVANQENLIASKDLADRLIHKLYTVTRNCEQDVQAYLRTLPGKEYRLVEDQETPAAA